LCIIQKFTQWGGVSVWCGTPCVHFSSFLPFRAKDKEVLSMPRAGARIRSRRQHGHAAMAMLPAGLNA